MPIEFTYTSDGGRFLILNEWLDVNQLQRGLIYMSDMGSLYWKQDKKAYRDWLPFVETLAGFQTRIT
jgi:hypothetical protein